MTDVLIPIDGRTAGVNTHVRRVQRPKLLYFAGGGVIKTQHKIKSQKPKVKSKLILPFDL
jgi:hypothetical protein